MFHPVSTIDRCKLFHARNTRFKVVYRVVHVKIETDQCTIVGLDNLTILVEKHKPSHWHVTTALDSRIHVTFKQWDTFRYVKTFVKLQNVFPAQTILIVVVSVSLV